MEQVAARLRRVRHGPLTPRGCGASRRTHRCRSSWQSHPPEGSPASSSLGTRRRRPSLRTGGKAKGAFARGRVAGLCPPPGCLACQRAVQPMNGTQRRSCWTPSLTPRRYTGSGVRPSAAARRAWDSASLPVMYAAAFQASASKRLRRPGADGCGEGGRLPSGAASAGAACGDALPASRPAAAALAPSTSSALRAIRRSSVAACAATAACNAAFSVANADASLLASNAEAHHSSLRVMMCAMTSAFWDKSGRCVRLEKQRTALCRLRRAWRSLSSCSDANSAARLSARAAASACALVRATTSCDSCELRARETSAVVSSTSGHDGCRLPRACPLRASPGPAAPSPAQCAACALDPGARVRWCCPAAQQQNALDAAPPPLRSLVPRQRNGGKLRLRAKKQRSPSVRAARQARVHTSSTDTTSAASVWDGAAAAGVAASVASSSRNHEWRCHARGEPRGGGGGGAERVASASKPVLSNQQSSYPTRCAAPAARGGRCSSDQAAHLLPYVSRGLVGEGGDSRAQLRSLQARGRRHLSRCHAPLRRTTPGYAPSLPAGAAAARVAAARQVPAVGAVWQCPAPAYAARAQRQRPCHAERGRETRLSATIFPVYRRGRKEGGCALAIDDRQVCSLPELAECGAHVGAHTAWREASAEGKPELACTCGAATFGGPQRAC